MPTNSSGPLIGYSLSSEEHGPRDLIRFAGLAKEHGFSDIGISDHYHPWVEAQGESPFVWSVLAGIAATVPGVRLGTLVTCPTIRTHPAVVAQAVATTSLLCQGRFFLGVGTGENLNEHIAGDRWPPFEVRVAMLEEAMEIMRALWTGDNVTRRGQHYVVEDARLYSAPDGPIPMPVSGFGPRSTRFAGEHGDGYVTTSPDADMVAEYRKAGGEGPVIGSPKACWAADEKEARRTVHRLWPNTGLPGELAQELRTPTHFQQACELVDEETAVGSTPVGPDPEVHAASIRAYLEAGFDEVYVHQIGDEQEPFLRFYRDEVLPRL